MFFFTLLVDWYKNLLRRSCKVKYSGELVPHVFRSSFLFLYLEVSLDHCDIFHDCNYSAFLIERSKTKTIGKIITTVTQIKAQ